MSELVRYMAERANSHGYDLEPDDVLAALDDAERRCPSCEHRATFHQPDACWYSITDAKPGTSVGCNCIGWTP